MPREGLVSALENLDEKTKTILLVDDNSDDALLIRRFLEARKSYRVFHAKDGWEGLTEARQRLPDLIVLDLTMPEMDGFSVIEKLKFDPRTKKIPVIVVSAKDITAEEHQRLNGYIEGLYQKGSIPVRAFVNQVVEVNEQKTLPRQANMTATVLYIEDTPDNMPLIKRAIEAIGHKFVGKPNGIEGLKEAEEISPDLILLDINLPDLDGYEIARRLRASKNQHLLYVPIIAITANALKGDSEKALEAGCDVYMSKPINIRELWSRVETLLDATKS